MKKVQQMISAVIFLAVLFGLMFSSLLLPKKSVSETENRTLAEVPQLTAAGIKDKSYMDGVETYAADHFVLRDQWVAVKSAAELAAGKKEIGGVYITDERLIGKLTEDDVDETRLKQSIDGVRAFAQNTETPVAMLLAPTAAEVYSDTLPAYAPNLDQQQLISRVADDLRGDVTMINVYNSLYAMCNEYIYYRTDHHWTSYGAFLAYQTAIKKLGFSPVSYEMYNIEHAADDFRGTLYSKSLYRGIEPDMIDLYHYNGTDPVTSVTINDGLNETEYQSIYFCDFLNTSEKYSVFLGRNAAMVTVRTNVKNDKKLLLIKDSYANSMLPFLTEHYSEIVLLDMRYVRGDYHAYVDPDQFSQVLVLYNVSNFATDGNIKLLAAQ
ncbi:DHHW family protein [uncultured Ruminococcus sp.]|uniref:DHHW family protein n=1 Tax=uncultured Ruminococcus sp. TaxID=165186 RepID=UPI0025945CB0|nr:DHHW family protein [uncultured Ruminococcus sp.]